MFVTFNVDRTNVIFLLHQSLKSHISGMKLPLRITKWTFFLMLTYLKHSQSDASTLQTVSFQESFSIFPGIYN